MSHERGEDTHGAEGGSSVAFDENGGGRKDHLEGGVREGMYRLRAGTYECGGVSVIEESKVSSR